ncbi:MAG: sulfite exporter TauE/SafE family protein, partial [Bacteroidia bacterium]|nr:sulfite exporter TauE/SafE family protein [Bacteroidia bacterium]
MNKKKMEVVGYILGILVGIVLGLFGAGGAIISFPILVYFMNIPPVEAGPYSLIIVGISAIAGLYAHLKNKHIDIKVSLLFSIPMIFSFYIFKYWLLPLLPFTISNFRTMNITINHVMLLLFLIVMSVLVYRMFNASQSDKDETPNSSANNTLKYILYSSLVGILA